MVFLNKDEQILQHNKINAEYILDIMKENNIRVDDILKADGYFAWTLWVDEDVEERFQSCCEENGINSDMVGIDTKNRIFKEVKARSQKLIEDESCMAGYDVLMGVMRRAMKTL